MTDPTRQGPGGERLSESRLAQALRQGVPEPDAPEGLIASVPRRARQLRARRRAGVSAAVAAVVVLVIGVPLGFAAVQTSSPEGPAAPSPTSDVGPRFCPAGDEDCAAVVATVRKPLRLPAVAAGQSCPVSASRTMKGVEGMTRRVRAAGPGPLYLTGLPTIAVEATQTSGLAKGWYGQKVIWLVDRDYAGPLLLRGTRIDGRGALGFDHYVGAAGYDQGSGDGRPHRSLVYVRIGVGVTPVPSAAAYPSYPSGIYVTTPGCYAIQVDGVGFSEHLVFRVTSR